MDPAPVVRHEYPRHRSARGCLCAAASGYDQVTRFSDDPVAQARSWQAQGATRLHLVDLDGARRGEPVNDAVVRAITASLDIPVQLGGGVRSLERAEDLLACGLDRVILGTVAIERPAGDGAGRASSGRIIVGDAKHGRVAAVGSSRATSWPRSWRSS